MEDKKALRLRAAKAKAGAKILARLSDGDVEDITAFIQQSGNKEWCTCPRTTPHRRNQEVRKKQEWTWRMMLSRLLRGTSSVFITGTSSHRMSFVSVV
jgi:hypothetical protein